MPEPPTIFILDDDDGVRDWLQDLFESAGYATESFPSAVDFLKTYDDRRHGCVIADVRMPGMTGLELQERLRERDVPLSVVIMTGHGDIAMATRALRAGAVDFIEKPFTNNEILDAVQRAVEAGSGGRSDRAGGADAALSQRRMGSLSALEKEVLREIMTGRSTTAAAAFLDMPAKTVELHRARIMEKLGAESMTELIRLAWADSVSALALRFQFDDEGAPEAVLRGAVESARAIIGARFSAAAVLESDRPEIQWFATAGLDPIPAAAPPPADTDSLLVRVAADRRPKRVTGLPGDPRLVGLTAGFPSVHTLLAVPLATRQRVLGWLALFDKIGADGFSDDDEQIALARAWGGRPPSAAR
ncbi:MAG: response regulator [Proteobacteria bacterium]|nr:response regulator [Pseudomonadota bacterium]